MSKTRRAEIAGAGLAGLALATRLAHLGWHVSLHERSADLRMFGSGIWLWENGLKTLQLLGAYEAATARARHVKEWRIADGSGATLYSKSLEGRDRLLLPPRADLYQALIDRATAAGVHVFTNSVVASVRPEGVLVLEGGEQRPADLVVVADGAYSRLRENIMATAWSDMGTEGGFRLLVPAEPDDPTDIITEYWSGHWRVMFNPCTDGENYIYLGGPVNDARGRAVPIDPAFWRERFPGAGEMFSRVGQVSRWDRIVNMRTRLWADGHIAILGDAANAMPPNLGQSANMAFSNAMALAMAVTAGSDVPGSLRAWEARQRPLTDHVQHWSYVYGLILGRWPASIMPLRSDLMRMLGKMEWFDEGICRGARHVPEGSALF